MRSIENFRHRNVAFCLSAFTFVAFALSAGEARANEIEVDTTTAPNTSGDGKCGILEAVYAAQNDVPRDSCLSGGGPDIIRFKKAGSYSVPSLDAWSTDITFQGTGMHQTTLVLAGEGPPGFLTGLDEFDCPPSGFYISSSATISLRDLTLRPATGVQNQAVCVASGTLNLDRVRVTDFDLRGIYARYAPNSNGVDVSLGIRDSLIDHNHAYNDGLGGAGIYYFLESGEFGGSFEVHRTTISDNVSEDVGGGVYVGGPLTANGNRHMSQDTISGNFAAKDGGGLYYDFFQNYLQLDWMTIANNHAMGIGGGIFKAPNSANLQLGGSIITDNTVDGDARQRNLNADTTPNSISCMDTVIYLPAPFWTSQNRPFQGNSSLPCQFGVSSGGLGALMGRGGANNLPVQRLLTGSIGIDSSKLAPPTTDERGLLSPVDGDGNGTKVGDRGAFELHPRELEVESFTMVSKSSDAHVIASDGCAAPTLNCLYSGGSGTNLQANGTNDFVIYRTGSLPTGTFAVTLRYKRAPNAGRFQVGVSSSQSGPFASLGEQDGFAPAADWVTVTLPNITIGTAGQKFFRFTVTGRNSSSSGFQVFPDTIDLVK